MLQMYNAGSQCFMSLGQGSGSGPLNGLVMGVSNAAHYITGRENLPMIFATNDTERLRITSAGNIGVGTDNPDATLKVNVASGNNGVVVQNTSTANIALFGARNGDATVQIGQWGSTASGSTFGLSNADLSFIYTTSYGTTHPSALALGTVSNKPIVFATNNTERVRITSAGDVGIGTAVPITASGYASLSLADTTGAQIEFKKFGGQTHYIWSDNNLNIGADYHGSGQNLVFKVNGNNERARIDSAGNMGLGVTPIAPGNTALHIGETTSGDPVRLHMTTANTGHTASDGFTLSIDGSSSAVNLIQRENAAIQIYTNNAERSRVDTDGMIVNNGYRISTTSGGTTLANPYSLGALASATIPSYPHFTGTWLVMGSVPCNNTWHDLLHSIGDSNGLFHGYSGDASSKNIFQYQYSLTSPGYGVNNLSQRFMNGAWNTGSVSFQLRNNSGPWTLQIKATSHYNSSNNAGFRIMFHSYY